MALVQAVDDLGAQHNFLKIELEQMEMNIQYANLPSPSSPQGYEEYLDSQHVGKRKHGVHESCCTIDNLDCEEYCLFTPYHTRRNELELGMDVYCLLREEALISMDAS